MTSITRKKPVVPKKQMVGAKRGPPRKRVRARTTSEEKKVGELVGRELINLEEWFAEYRSLLLGNIAAVDDTIGDAHPDDKEGLRALRSENEEKLAKLAQEHEAFFNDGTLALNPPSQPMIDRTKELAREMDGLIREQKRAEAIVRLLGEIANLATKVGVTP